MGMLFYPNVTEEPAVPHLNKTFLQFEKKNVSVGLVFAFTNHKLLLAFHGSSAPNQASGLHPLNSLGSP